jgi:3-carboxy-cis,cis-muconate cycloisomerase
MSINPADSEIFGTLYGSDRMREIFDDRTLLKRMLDTEAALARVQARLGIIPRDAAEAITKAATLDAIDIRELADSVRNAGTPVVGVTRALSKAAGEAGRWVHWGATTQDIVDTAVVLQIRSGLDLLHGDLLATIQALAAQADRHRHTVMAGRTFLQHALPITFGLKCAGWLQPLVTDIERIDQLRPRIERVQFGGAVGTLASLGNDGVAVMVALAAELGLAAPAAPWHAARDGMAETASFLGILCGTLAKIGTDIGLLAQTDVGEVQEPHEEGRGGSSTLPHKRNPIAAVYLLGACRAVHALVPVLMTAMATDHERGTGPWQSESLALLQCFVLTHGALLHARTIAEGMVVNAERMRANLEQTQGLIMTEAVSMALAPALGRGEAHRVVKHASDLALAKHIHLSEALQKEDAVTSRMDHAAIAKLTDPATYLGSTEAFIDRVLAQVQALQ